MSRWHGFEEFAQVVDSGSFSKAADNLSVSKSFISKQISQLEERLGARLLQRTTRRLALTEVGEAYYKHCIRIIDELEEAETEVTKLQIEPQGVLKINSVSGRLGETFFATAFAEFLKLYPKITLDVRFSKNVDLTDDFDLALGTKSIDSSLMSRQLTHIHFHICASPEYFKTHPKPKKPEDLDVHNCLVSSSRIWTFRKNKKNKEIKVHGNWYANSSEANRVAACSGLGIARLPAFAAYQDIKAGKLIPVLTDWQAQKLDFWIFYPHRRYMPAKLRTLIDFFIDFFYPSPPWKKLGVDDTIEF